MGINNENVYQFQVYQKGGLLVSVGEAIEGVKRLRFAGHFNEDHYDVYWDVSEYKNANNVCLSDDKVQQ